MADTERTESEILSALQSRDIDLSKYAFPIDVEKCFPKTSGMGWKGDVKLRAKYLDACHQQLQKTLKEGEEVLYIGKGVQQKFLEQYFMGIWAAYINQTVFVFTNLRVILFNSDGQGTPKHTFWSIFYNEIEKFKGSLLGSASLKLRDGAKFSYGGFKGIDRKKIPAVVEEARSEYKTLGFTPQSTQSRENLCSQCVEVVPKDQYTCPNCGQQFYEPKQLALRSLIFPSWGDFCMKHTMFACFEILTYVVSWAIFVGAVVAAVNDPQGSDLTIVVVIGLIFIAFEHIMDALLTYFIAKKGLNPR